MEKVSYDDHLEPVQSRCGDLTIVVEIEHVATYIPGPWRAEPNEAGNFVIKDASGFALAYVCARSDPALRDQFLTPAEALVIAEAIAKLGTSILERTR